GYLGKDRKVSSAAGGNLSRMHKTQETAKESRLNFMYSHLRNRTLAICLPTGSGKSLCAFLPAIMPINAETDARGVSLVIVPTVALALDLEKRMGELVGHSIAYRPENIAEAEAIRARCAAGVQGPVIASPEALAGGLLAALRAAASEGWLRYFVIDEAHMVLSW